MSRLLIVNADDFGRSAGINDGVAQAHEHGIVTSASLMVRWADATSAGEYARSRPELSVGLHIDLSEWRFERGDWVTVYERGSTASDVEREIRAQLECFRELVGSDPTHIDSHQHVHRADPVRRIASEIADGLGVPLRDTPGAIAYRGEFYGQTGQGVPVPGALTLEGLEALLRSFGPGITELGCHPSASLDFESSYAAERLVELALLCSDEVEALVASTFTLTSFHEIRVRESGPQARPR